VDGMAHQANGIESLWAVPKSAFHGGYHAVIMEHFMRFGNITMYDCQTLRRRL